MSVAYYRQYQARHKPRVRLQSEGLGHSRGVGVNACEGCHYLRKCQARIRSMYFWPFCFTCSKYHFWYVRRYGNGRNNDAG